MDPSWQNLENYACAKTCAKINNHVDVSFNYQSAKQFIATRREETYEVSSRAPQAWSIIGTTCLKYSVTLILTKSKQIHNTNKTIVLDNIVWNRWRQPLSLSLNQAWQELDGNNCLTE